MMRKAVRMVTGINGNKVEERLACNEEGSGGPRRATAFSHKEWGIGAGWVGEWWRQV
jgi:hypothetical protein